MTTRQNHFTRCVLVHVSGRCVTSAEARRRGQRTVKLKHKQRGQAMAQARTAKRNSHPV